MFNVNIGDSKKEVLNEERVVGRSPVRTVALQRGAVYGEKIVSRFSSGLLKSENRLIEIYGAETYQGEERAWLAYHIRVEQPPNSKLEFGGCDKAFPVCNQSPRS